jgi:hypothetical protein
MCVYILTEEPVAATVAVVAPNPVALEIAMAVDDTPQRAYMHEKCHGINTSQT